MLPFAEHFHESKPSPRRDLEDEKKKEKRFSFFIVKVSGSFMSSGDSSRSAFLDVSSGSDGDEYVGSSWVSVALVSARPELTRKLVNGMLQRVVNDAWSLRPGQFEVVAALWRGSDVVCTFPTSAGKTLIMMLGPLLDSHFCMESIWVTRGRGCG